jgi:hypothetical protein
MSAADRRKRAADERISAAGGWTSAADERVRAVDERKDKRISGVGGWTSAADKLMSAAGERRQDKDRDVVRDRDKRFCVPLIHT